MPFSMSGRRSLMLLRLSMVRIVPSRFALSSSRAATPFTVRFSAENGPPFHSTRILSVSITAPSPMRVNACLTGGITRLIKVRLGRSSNEPSSLHSQRIMRSVRSVKRALPTISVLPSATAHDAAQTASEPSTSAPALPEKASAPVPALANVLRETVSHNTPSPPLLAGTRFIIALPFASSRRTEYHFA